MVTVLCQEVLKKEPANIAISDRSGGGGWVSLTVTCPLTDHCPMLFVHSKMVRHRLDGRSLLVKKWETEFM